MKRIISILFVVALVLGALMVGSSAVLAVTWDGAATIRDETFYVASSQLTLGALGTDYYGNPGYTITDPFQINLEYQAGILDSDIANINTYLFPYNAAHPSDHTDGSWDKNFSDNDEYVLDVNPGGGCNIYKYQGTATYDPAIEWTLTGWNQTILAGDIIDNGDGTITLRVQPFGTYRPFVNDPPVNNVEVFDGQLDCEVLGYRFAGNVGALGPTSILTPILVGSGGTKTTTGGGAFFTSSAGSIEDLTGVATPPNPPVSLPYGMFSFKITGLSSGGTVTITVELPGPVPVGTKWWKYYNSNWYPLPIGDDDGDNIITVTLTDGAIPDDADGSSTNGEILDDGGPGGGPVGWETYPISKVRVLLPWIALLAAIMAGASLLVLRRRRRVQS